MLGWWVIGWRGAGNDEREVSLKVVRNLPSDNDDLALHSHRLDSGGEHLVGLIGEGGEVLHLVCGWYGRANFVLREDGNGGVQLALRSVDHGWDLVLVHRVGLKDGVADGEATMAGGHGTTRHEGDGLARSQVRDTGCVVCSEHVVSL